jgi:hypothetical protein
VRRRVLRRDCIEQHADDRLIGRYLITAGRTDVEMLADRQRLLGVEGAQRKCGEVVFAWMRMYR